MQNEVSQKCVTTTKSNKRSENTDNIVHTNYITQDDKSPRQTIPISSVSAKAQKLARYILIYNEYFFQMYYLQIFFIFKV